MKTEHPSFSEQLYDAQVRPVDLKLGATALTWLASTESLRGPRSSDVPYFDGMTLAALTGPAVMKYLDDDKGDRLLDGIASDVSRLAKKAGVPRDKIDLTDIVRVYGERIRTAAVGANFPTTVTGHDAIRRLVVNHPNEYIEEYFSDGFMDSLATIAQEHPALADEIPQFFTMSERIRQARYSAQPLEQTQKAVERVIAIIDHPRESGLTDETVVNLLPPAALLELTTRYTESYPDMLQNLEKNFALFTAEFPEMATHIPQIMARDMLRVAGADLDLDKVRQKFRSYEDAAQLLIRGGEDKRTAYYAAARYVFGNSTDAAHMQTNGMGMGRHHLRQRSDETGGLVARRHEHAHRAGRITEYQTSALALTVEDRDTLYDIDESETVTDGEKRTLYQQLKSAREQFTAFSLDIAQALGSHEVADSLRMQSSEALTKVLYAIRFCIDHPNESPVVPMGSADIPILGNKDDMLRALTILSSRLPQLATVIPRDRDVTIVQHREKADNVELGYVNNSVLVMTKAGRNDVTVPVEHGRSARINIALGDGMVIPSSVAEEREQTALSIRLDLDKDGILRLDIGGKTSNPHTPDFMVAKLLSLGAWYRQQLHGGDSTDYHLDIASMSEQTFAKDVEAFRAALVYDERAMNVPRVPLRGAQQAPGVLQTQPALHAVPDEKFAA